MNKFRSESTICGKQYGHYDHEIVIREGDVVETIVQQALEHNCDFTIIGAGDIRNCSWTALDGLRILGLDNTITETTLMPPHPPPHRKVYFFGTCLIDAIFPQAGLSAVELLEREGVSVVFPPEQSCCGQPAFNAGFPDEARKVARRQLHIFHRDYPIVVPSGSCAGMMKCHYPELFAGDRDEALARRFSDRVYELGQFLAKVLKVRLTDRGAPLKITWHSSCHAMREMAVIDDAKSLLRQLAHVELAELEREHECCGFGGTFSVKQPMISAAMVRDKLEDILKTGARRVISGDCGCLLNIQGALDKSEAGVPAQHLAEFLWERTHG